MKSITFFNNKGGVGKTTLVYHVAWMLHRLGARVLVADLDPQANLTAAFLDDAALEDLSDTPLRSVFGAIEPLVERLGDVRDAHVADVEGIGLIPGDLALSKFEDRLAEAWLRCLDDDAASAADAFRVTTAFHRLLLTAATARKATVALIDVGPNLGALNRAALVAADTVVVPVATDLYSLRGLQHLGAALADWRSGWQARCDHARQHALGLALPKGRMEPLGYVVVQPGNESIQQKHVRAGSLAFFFHEAVLRDPVPVGADPACIAVVRHFRGLLPMSREARKPVFDLTAADGAIGSYAVAVKDAYAIFEKVTPEIAARAGVPLPPP